MSFDTTFLRSKLGRRIFWLFALCALSPMAVWAAISLHDVTDQLREQSRRELGQLSHEVGMGLYEHLLFLEADLKLAEADLSSHGEHGPIPNNLPSYFSHRFKGVELIQPDSSRQILFGTVSGRFRLESGELAHLSSSKTLVSVRNCDDGPCVFVVRQVNAEPGRGGFLAGEVSPTYVLDADDLPPGKGLCILDPKGSVLLCSGEYPASTPPGTFRSASGQFTWSRGSTGYEAAYWNVFLKPSFLVDHLTVVASEPKELVFLPMAQFKRSFLLVTLLALLVVLILSVSQIRLNLIPLGKLQEGTRRIADGDFHSRVTVESRDEFDDLARSFNSMAAQIEKQFKDLKELDLGTLTALARAIDAKSSWTSGHSERVTETAMEIGREVGLSRTELDVLNRGGLLHDVGKIGVPESVLDKPGKLTDEEMTQIREHVEIGRRILEPVPGLAECMPIVVQHHEWFDGGGYPKGLAGDEISLYARIFAVADCFDAMISDRPYRSGLPVDQVLQILRDGTGKQFDPQVMDAFFRIVARKDHLSPIADVFEVVTAS
jgi:putative nucleotidyltransferase with HDIG domain